MASSNQGKVIILNALFWGLLLVGASIVFKESPHKERVMTYVGLATVMGGLAVSWRYRKENKNKPNDEASD